MEHLIIEQSKNTLGVEFDPHTGEFSMEGSSFPENTFDFFSPIISLLEKYMLEKTEKLTVDFKFDYLNSSSIKFISDIIDKLQIYYNSGGKVELNWYYYSDDDDILEMGEEFKEDVDFIFNIHKI
jgi:hypothetical protein